MQLKAELQRKPQTPSNVWAVAAAAQFSRGKKWLEEQEMEHEVS